MQSFVQWVFYGFSIISVVVTTICASILYQRIAGTLVSNVDSCRNQLSLTRLLDSVDTTLNTILETALGQLKKYGLPSLIDSAIASGKVLINTELSRFYSITHKADSEVVEIVSIVKEVLVYLSIGILCAVVLALVLRVIHTVLISMNDEYYQVQMGVKTNSTTRFVTWATQLLAYTALVLVVALGVACASIDAYAFHQVDTYIKVIQCSFSSDMVGVGIATAISGGVAIVTILAEPLVWHRQCVMYKLVNTSEEKVQPI